MKLTLLLFLTIFSLNLAFSQTAYIQVNGEPGLSVYLNNQFKGKTTAEFKGYIIENVTPGKNQIKIEKEGYVAFEEYITVKPGEVFAYTVKPFTKHVVSISQSGNSDVSETKEIIKTGKLIVQSVPIEIKITMPDIEGVNGSQKIKDEWIADKIPAGSYTITFTYNQKAITKTVKIDGNETTRVFVNMLNEEFKSESTLKETLKKQRDSLIVCSVIDSLCQLYKFKPGLTETGFKNYNAEAAGTIMSSGYYDQSRHTYSYAYYKTGKYEKFPGPSYLSFRSTGSVWDYWYNVLPKEPTQQELTNAANSLKALEARVPAANYRKEDDGCYMHFPAQKLSIEFKYYSPTQLSVHFITFE
jgi:hypothetical protein